LPARPELALPPRRSSRMRCVVARSTSAAGAGEEPPDGPREGNLARRDSCAACRSDPPGRPASARSARQRRRIRSTDPPRPCRARRRRRRSVLVWEPASRSRGRRGHTCPRTAVQIWFATCRRTRRRIGCRRRHEPRGVSRVVDDRLPRRPSVAGSDQRKGPSAVRVASALVPQLLVPPPDRLGQDLLRPWPLGRAPGLLLRHPLLDELPDVLRDG